MMTSKQTAAPPRCRGRIQAGHQTVGEKSAMLLRRGLFKKLFWQTRIARPGGAGSALIEEGRVFFSLFKTARSMGRSAARRTVTAVLHVHSRSQEASTTSLPSPDALRANSE